MGSRSIAQFVPPEFVVPAELLTTKFKLRMLSIGDVEKDFEAVTSSAAHLSEVWPDTGWPHGLTLNQNLVDLGWHEKEFQNRSSFAYTVVTLDESYVLGCVYFYPTNKSGYDAEVFLWVRESELSVGLDAELFTAVDGWLAAEWPFRQPAYPGRKINWDDWSQLPDK
ncbi:MAG: GNAT family N-acetyltransferase [Halieaceae bacterium]|jgi:hypothetical protein|nr:GNAT family N-acetyltransferase [Halieaceae bacterium]